MSDGQLRTPQEGIDVTRGSRTHQIVFWLLAVTTLALGIYLSHIDFLGEEWVSRAGCVIVALGIWSGLGGLMRERILLKGLELRRRMVVVRIRRRYRAQAMDPDRIEEQVGDAEASFKERAEALEKDLKLSVGILEISLLLTGTLIWGFGDLLSHLG